MSPSPPSGGRQREARGRHRHAGYWITPPHHRDHLEEPGGPAEMVPGQHHVRLNVYIAQASNGDFKVVVKGLGMVDPKECQQAVQ